MLSLFQRQSTKVEVNTSVGDHHGLLVARDTQGVLQELSFHADRPELLRDPDQKTLDNIFEQFGRQGYIPHYLEIKGVRHEAPKAARQLEELLFG